MDAGGVHGGIFVFGGALAAADDRARVAHATTWWGGLTRDETYYRFFYVGFDVLGGAFLGVASDFADEDDGVGVGIFVEHFDGVQE